MIQDTGLFFGQFPQNFDSLQAVLVSVRDGVGHSSETLSEARQFYREIIFTEPDLLIAPESKEYLSSDKAFIIAQDNVLQSARLLSTLEKFSLEKTQDIPVTRNMFLYCFEFVVSHRLAPFWNKIGPYYIKGRDFLLENERMCAIIANFSLTDKINLGLKAMMLKLPPPKIEDFGVSPNIAQQFRQSSDFLINGHSLENNTCLVLPSLKTGYITRVAHKTAECFDFKRYWKVMYGFRLPVSSVTEDLLYSVRFPTSDKTFSRYRFFSGLDCHMVPACNRYPECCIRSKEPRVFLRCEQKALFSSFMEDLLSRLPSLCGAPLKFTSTSLHPTATIYSASLSKQTNLTRSSMPSKSTQPFVFTAKNVSQNKSPRRETSEKRLTIASPQNLFQENTSSVGIRQRGKKPYIPCFTKRRLSDKGLKAISTINNEQEIQLSPIVPCFTSRKSVGGSSRKKTGREYGKRDISNTTTKTQHTTMKNQASSVAGEKEKFFLANNELGITEHATGNNMAIYQQSKDINWKVIDSRPELEQNRQRFFSETECVIPGSKRKKTDKKPKAEVNYDIRKLAMENKLSKANAVAISKWLKYEGVKCKSHEKKAELIRKVYEFLELGQPEP